MVSLIEIGIPDDIKRFLEELLEREDLIKAVKENLLRFILILVKNVDISIFEISSKKIKDTIEDVQGIEDSFLREMLLSILYFDYWKVKLMEENGIVRYIEKVLENMEKILVEIELTIWALLYTINKEKVLKYKDYIKNLIESIKEGILEFIPEEKPASDEIIAVKKALEEVERGEYVVWK